MSDVNINPAPNWILDRYHRRPHPKFLPRPERIFGNSHKVWDESRKCYIASRPPIQDIALALELWRALDPVSRHWYVTCGWSRGSYWLPLTSADLDECGADQEEIDQFMQHRRNAGECQ